MTTELHSELADAAELIAELRRERKKTLEELRTERKKAAESSRELRTLLRKFDELQHRIPQDVDQALDVLIWQRAHDKTGGT